MVKNTFGNENNERRCAEPCRRMNFKELIVMFGLVPFAGRHDLAERSSANPFALFDAMRDSFFRDGFPAANWGAAAFKVDVKEMDDHYELTADLPGMKKEDVALHYENGYLTVAASHDESKDEKDEAGNYIRRERHTGEVSRSFYIDGIDEANIHAEFKDGVLQVKLPKAAGEPQRKQIEIH